MTGKPTMACLLILLTAAVASAAEQAPSAELQQAIQGVKTTWQETSHPYKRAGAVLEMGAFDEPAMVDFLVDQLSKVGKSRSNFIIRHTIAHRISELKAEPTLERVIFYLDSPSMSARHRTRAVLVRGLALGETDMARTGILKGLKDRYPAVRVEAARFAARAPSPESIPLLIDMLGYRYRKVRAQIHNVLMQITGCRLPARKGPWESWWEENGNEIAKLPVPDELQKSEKIRTWPVVEDFNFVCRTTTGRQQALRRYAPGNFHRPVLSAIRGGLQWLADHQSDDGYWDVDGFWKDDPQYKDMTLAEITKERKRREENPGAWEERSPLPGIGSTGDRMDLPATALAIMAFCGQGHTHRNGDYTRTVGHALEWLIRQQDRRTGAFSRNMYEHAICAHAVIEVWGMTRDFRLRQSAQKATDFLCEAQNENGGWRYGPNAGSSDSSVSSWCTMALQTARRCDLEVPPRNLIWCRTFWEQVTVYAQEEEGKEYGQAFYMLNADGTHSGSGTYANTAASILCRLFMGTQHNARSIQAGAVYLKDASTDDINPNIYMWIYATQAFFQIGGQPWRHWQKQVMPATAKLQVQARRGGRTGDEGSFWSETRWISSRLGRVGVTAASCLVLESYFFYPRIKNE